MLSKVERKYLEDIEAFEDKYGREYAKVVRSRIRKKAERAIKDLILIINKDGAGREPLKELRDRNNERSMKKIREGMIKDENELQLELTAVKIRSMLNRTWRGRREESMLKGSWFGELVYVFSRERPWMAEYLVEKIEEGKKNGMELNER